MLEIEIKYHTIYNVPDCYLRESKINMYNNKTYLHRVQFLFHNMAGLLYNLAESVSVPRSQAAAPADNSVYDCTGHHRLIEIA